MASEKPFPLMQLPAELRELVYYHASDCFPPINTAAIKNHGLIKIPVIAQVSQEVRKEVLAVLTRNRELQISLHCVRNIERAWAWLNAQSDEALAPTVVTFSGVLQSTKEFLHFTIRYRHETSAFQVLSRPCASEDTEKECQELEKKLSLELAKIAAVEDTTETRGRLTIGEVKGLFLMVEQDSGWADTRKAARARTAAPVRFSSRERRRLSSIRG